MGDARDLTWKSVDELESGTPATTDLVVYYDVSTGDFKKCTVATLLAVSYEV